ncbi:MAG: hypothetical protein KatS3mg050_1283 [Litorilinea sp.]|nr:MAG: hypothetical protein KatS3mg050_1283 [Litorilinea sp.]
MAKTTVSASTQMTDLVQELREYLRAEFVGLVLFVAGALVLFTLGGDTPSWAEKMVGWTAPLWALALLLTGGVLMSRGRLGYWSVEAILGAELTLLALQSGTFAWHHATFDWSLRADGTNGGLVGWALGGILVATLGQWPAFVFICLVGLVGLVLLWRYTPLLYVAALLAHYLPPLARAVGQRLSAWFPPPEELEEPEAEWRAPLPATENFVPPVDEEPPAATPAPRRARTSSPAQAREASKPTRKGREKGARAQRPARPENSRLPPLDLLTPDSGTFQSGDVHLLGQLIEQTLHDFNVPVKVVHMESGPTVTQFGVEPLYVERSGKRRKVRVNRIVNLADDLALALAAPAVRIEAPVPGRPYVGIEVPNPEKTMVGLRGILESEAMRRQSGALLVGLGRDTAGAPVVMDLARAPHLLIAGATGAGKSVCINTIITSLLMQHGPETLRFVMVDPKMVELPGYNGIPHLIGNVITDVDHVMGALTWLLLQMDDRYRLFRELGVRNIDAYNKLARGRKRQAGLEPMPYIVLIIDELADLMMTAGEDIERQICRLAQMARATGIHLILATQRPSTDVVTGLIKANFPSRIAFAVSSQVDSRVILDTPGAERLLGRGDMLLMRPDLAKLLRCQGCFVSDEEIARVVAFWKAEAGDTSPAAVPPWNSLLDQLDDEDELIQDAIDVLRGMSSCSTSLLQRKLRVGYPKAARLMEELEARGIVGPDLGGGQGREVLLKEEEDEEGEVEG